MQSALPQLSFELECKPNTLPTSDKGNSPTSFASSDVRLLWSRGRHNFGGSFRAIWRSSVRKEKHNRRQFLAKSLKMEDWDIPVEDDFESRYADELEMLDDFEGKCLLLCSQ